MKKINLGESVHNAICNEFSRRTIYWIADVFIRNVCVQHVLNPLRRKPAHLYHHAIARGISLFIITLDDPD